MKYELNYNDSFRAMQRKIYTREVKNLSATLKPFANAYANKDVYGQVLRAIKKGIYENLGVLEHEVNLQVLDDNDRLEYLSPMELRLNSLSVKRVNDLIAVLDKYSVYLPELVDIAYSTGKITARSFQKFNFGLLGKEIKLNLPAKSAKTLIKKYDNSLKLGEWPTAKLFYTQDKHTIKYVHKCNELNIKCCIDYMKTRGIESTAKRKHLFDVLNCAYYDISPTKIQNLEIGTLVFAEDAFNKPILSNLAEFEANEQKLNLFKLALSKAPKESTYAYYEKLATKIGKKARANAIEYLNIVPEALPAFYEAFSKQEMLFQKQKTNEQKANDSQEQTK